MMLFFVCIFSAVLGGISTDIITHNGAFVENLQDLNERIQHLEAELRSSKCQCDKIKDSAGLNEPLSADCRTSTGTGDAVSLYCRETDSCSSKNTCIHSIEHHYRTLMSEMTKLLQDAGLEVHV